MIEENNLNLGSEKSQNSQQIDIQNPQEDQDNDSSFDPSQVLRQAEQQQDENEKENKIAGCNNKASDNDILNESNLNGLPKSQLSSKICIKVKSGQCRKGNKQGQQVQ